MISTGNNENGPTLLVRCDGCRAGFDALSAAPEAATAGIKAREWQTVRYPHRALHFCLSCKRDVQRHLDLIRIHEQGRL